MNVLNSLKRVLTIGNIFLIIVPVLLITMINMYLVNDNLSREISRRNMLITVSAAQEIDGFLKQAVYALTHVQEMDSFTNHEAQLQKSLDAMIHDFPYFESIQVTDETGHIKYMSPVNPELLGINLSGKEFFAASKKQAEPYWSATFISLQSGQPTVTLTIPFKTGVIVGYINLSNINAITSRIKIGEESFGTVIDHTGTYITHTNQQNVDQRAKDQFFKASHGILADQMTYEVEHNGVAMLASVAFVKSTKWPIILYQSKREAFLPIRNVALISLGVALLCITLTLLISQITLYKIMNSIENLLQWTREIAFGNYGYTHNEHSFQEFNDLAGNFNLMSDKIKAREEILRNQFKELKKSKEQLEYIGFHDSTTGLYNRAYFELTMKNLSEVHAQSVGIIMVDLDGLKLINDTFGHETGDLLLQAVAKLLEKIVRPGDIAARIGGDEFAILLPNSSNEILEKLCQHLQKTELVGDKVACLQYPISLSVGYAFSDNAKAAVELFREAEQNMYRAKLHKGQSLHSSTMKTLMKALEERDFITEGHCERIEVWVQAVGEMLGLKMSTIYDLRLLAKFHDIGKVGIPDRILFKPGSLDNEEWTEMRRHSEIGYRIAQSSLELMPIADLILKHHEHWNGKGYPLGLQGEEIPLECRILALADAYDAMTNERPYHTPKSHEAAVAELERCAGTHFDPNLVPIFIKMLGQYIGSTGII